MNEPLSAAITVPALGIKQETVEHNAEAEGAACCEVKVEKEQSDCNAGTIEIENNLVTNIKQEEECIIDCSEDEFMWENADNEQTYNIYEVYEYDTEPQEKEHYPTTLSRVNIIAEKELAPCTDDEMFSGSETDYCQNEESSDDEYEPAPKKAVPNRKGKKKLTPISTATPAKRGRPRKIVNVRAEKPKTRKPGLEQVIMQKMNEIAKVVETYRNPNKPPLAAMAHARSTYASTSLSTQLQNSRVQQDAFLRLHFLNWICPVCDIDCGSNYKWRQHLDKMHQLLDRENLNMEYLSNNRARCRQCYDDMPSIFTTVLKHKVTHLPHSDFIMCKLCHWRIGSLRGALLHLRREHAVDTIMPPPASCPPASCPPASSPPASCPPASCPPASCPPALCSPASCPPAEASVSVKLESNVCICPFCQESFLALTPMMTHISRLHRSVNARKAVYLCPDCGQRIQTKSGFHRHIVEAHNYDSVEKLRCVELEVACTSTTRAFKCLQCGMIEPQSAPVKMREHALSHSGVKCFQCVHCELSFESSKELRVHFCDELRQKFLVSYDSGVAHTKGKHKRPRFIRYVCPMCGEETDSKTKRSEHEESEHGMGTPGGLNFALVEGDGNDESGATYKCTVCEKKMKLDVALMYTHAVSHMPYNRWKCCRCSASFRRLHYTYSHNCTVAVKCPSKCPTKRRSNDHVYLHKYQYMMIHVCPVCNADFASRRRWGRHLREKHALNTMANMRMEAVDKRFLRCLDCNALVRSRYTNRREHRIQHLEYKPYRCKGCAKTFNTLSAISSHIVVCSKAAGINKDDNSIDVQAFTGIPSSSLLEGMPVRPSSSLLEGMPVRAKNQPAPPAQFEHKFVKITCPICADVAFTTLPEQQAHFRSVHNHFSDKFTLHANGSMNCQVCGKYFQDSDKCSMVKHQRSHFVKNCFHCLQCDSTAHTLSKLHAHIMTAHADELSRLEAATPIQAETEDPLETADSDLVQVSITRNAVKASNAPVKSQFSKYISYACPECNEPLPTESDWYAHITSLHSFFNKEEMNQEFTIDGEVVCTVCGVKVNQAMHHQQRHKLTHMPYKSFICTLCTHRSNTIGVLIQHMRRMHFLPGQYKCEVCAQVFGTSYERYKHIKEHDSADWPPNMCRICYVVRRTKSSLMHHLNMHDPNRRMFPCATCNCEYSNPSDLRRHVQACHAGASDPSSFEKYKCAVCEENCISLDALTAHMQRHDASEIPKTVCPICGKKFRVAKSCAVHKRSIHKAAPILPNNSGANVIESTGTHCKRPKKPVLSKTNGKAPMPCSSTESKDEDPDDEIIVPDEN